MSAATVRGLPSAVFGSGVAQRAELTEWDAAIRSARSTTRRIGFVSLATGAGATTLAYHVARIISSRRAEPVLAIDVSDDGRGLAARLGVGVTPPSETRANARTSAEAMTDLPVGDGWAALRPALADGAVGAWLGEAGPIARFFEVAITDFGSRHPLVDLAACAALCDVVCVVTDARRAPAELARAVAPAIAGLPEHPAAVLALVDHARQGDSVARALSRDAAGVVAVPFDRGLRSGGQPTSLATRRALLRLAATLVAGGEIA